ncbi:MAG: molybdopterin molybdotransferase MoeA [Firmicutes bacterium]|nr:molybdopterin molybdotransferase MoeA [Bacillota bacterium]
MNTGREPRAAAGSPAGAAAADLPGPEEALRRLLEHPDFAAAAAALAAEEPEDVPLEEALGRVLACDIAAPEDMPPFPRAHMDGFAVRAADCAGASAERPVRLRLAPAVAMGRAAGELAPGTAAPIATGGMLPAGADAVVPVEEAEAAGDAVAIFAPVAPGQHVTPAGADARAGERLLPSGRRLRPYDIAALAAVGRLRVPVRRRPRLLILPTGDELVPAERAPAPGQIREFNSWGLAAAARRDGAEARVQAAVPDDADALAAALAEAAREHEAVAVIGGSSVGARDWTAAAVRRLPGPGVLVHGVAMRPGRPTLVALVHADGRRPRPVFGLPGHPVSCLVVYDTLVRPALRRLLGAAGGPPPSVRARLARPLSNGALEFVARVELRPTGEGGPVAWEAWPVPGDSAILTSLARADGILRLPPHRSLEPGSVVEVELLRPPAF